MKIDYLYGEGFRILKVFFKKQENVLDAQGVAILKREGILYSSAIFDRFGDWLYAEPVPVALAFLQGGEK